MPPIRATDGGGQRSGEAIMLFRYFETLVSPFPDEAPTQPPATLWSFARYYTKPFVWLYLAVALTSAAIALIEVYAFDLVGSVVDWMTETGQEDFWSVHGGQILLISLLIAIIWPLMSLLDDLLLVQGIMGNMPMQIRWRGHRYLLRQSTAFFADDFAGRLSTKLMQTALGVREMMNKCISLFVYMSVYFLSAIILFGANDWRLTIPLIIWLIAYFVTMYVFLPRLQAWSEKQSDARSGLNGRIVDAYTNIQTVKMFSSGEAEDAYARKGMEDMLETVHPQMRIVTTMSFTLHVINGLLIVGTIILGSMLWSQNALSVGALAFAATMVLRIQGMSHYFLWEVSGLFENIGAVVDGLKTLSQPTAVVDRPQAALLTPKGGEVEFKNVTFRYGADARVMQKLSLHIRPGERVGLVGRSGAGKSTLVNLLLRLYDVEGGTIRIDGQNTADVRQDSLRSAIAVVTQDTSLLHRSIRENIAYGRPDASDEEIIEAARRAEAWDFIQTLKDRKGRVGLEAHVGERGVKLSGGQRQRIAIARVILKNAPILVLDEATSALDSEVEAAIQERMDLLMEDKTVVAIAHRLSTIAAMDRLIVLDEGAIVEQGRHEELIEQGGIYASLWSRQSGGFLNTGEVVAAE